MPEPSDGRDTWRLFLEYHSANFWLFGMLLAALYISRASSSAKLSMRTLLLRCALITRVARASTRSASALSTMRVTSLSRLLCASSYAVDGMTTRPSPNDLPRCFLSMAALTLALLMPSSRFARSRA